MEIKTSWRPNDRVSSIGCRKHGVVLWEPDRGAIQILMGNILEYGFHSIFQKFEGIRCNLGVN